VHIQVCDSYYGFIIWSILIPSILSYFFSSSALIYVSRSSCCCISLCCSFLIQSWSRPWYCTFDSIVIVLCSGFSGLFGRVCSTLHWVFLSFSTLLPLFLVSPFLSVCSDSSTLLYSTRHASVAFNFVSLSEFSIERAHSILLFATSQNAWYSRVWIGRLFDILHIFVIYPHMRVGYHMRKVAMLIITKIHKIIIVGVFFWVFIFEVSILAK
jgi:hypothetical protein